MRLTCLERVKMRRTLSLLAAGIFLFVAGCSLRRPSPSGENYYALGQHAFSIEDYKGATIYFQKLIDQYPFSPYAEDAELKIALAEYQMKEYPEAIGALSDFEKMHPTSKESEMASYYLAMAHFEQIGRPDQDQTHTRAALEQFETIERRYPETGFAALSEQQVSICRELLARHQLLIGDFYFSRANYRASESRYAELMQKWPDTPVGDQALYQLAVTLQKEGKTYSAAQAFAALPLHYPGTTYAAKAKSQLKRLNQPVDTEEDPLRLVLAESGYAEDSDDDVTVSQAQTAAANDSGAYGANGLPALNAPAAQTQAAAVQTASAEKTGPATLDRIRLSSSDPPLSIILDLTGPVQYDNELQNGNGFSTLTLHLKDTTPNAKLDTHLVFDRSIFRDCDISSDANGTTVTVNTSPVSRFAVVPLDAPPRLLVTFTPGSNEDQPGNGG